MARYGVDLSHCFRPATRPLVFAHRGGAALGPENTFEAFDRGLATGADGLELDVRLSRDGVAMVHHDATVDRTTNLQGAIGAYTADQLERADAAHHFSTAEGHPLRARGIGVPRLRDVLARYRDVPLIIELKDNLGALARAALEDVRGASAMDRVCLGSFHRLVLRQVRHLARTIATSAAREEIRLALYGSWVGLGLRRPAYCVFQVPERSGLTRVVSPRFVRVAHDADVAVQVWTVNDEADMSRLLDWGVDALITDRPDLAVPIAQGRRAARAGSESREPQRR